MSKEVGEHNKKHHRSHTSSTDSSFPSDEEIDFINERFIYSDELPTFDIRTLSPTGRSPSPIESDALSDSLSMMSLSPTNDSSKEIQMLDLVPLREINAQINSPVESNSNRSLETIFEGVFLETPPKKSETWRINLAKAVVRNSLSSFDVENLEDGVQSIKRTRKNLNSACEVFLKD